LQGGQLGQTWVIVSKKIKVPSPAASASASAAASTASTMSSSSGAFGAMDNVAEFLKACRLIGVKEQVSPLPHPSFLSVFFLRS